MEIWKLNLFVELIYVNKSKIKLSTTCLRMPTELYLYTYHNARLQYKMRNCDEFKMETFHQNSSNIIGLLTLEIFQRL
jgi:hypothetical protein